MEFRNLRADEIMVRPTDTKFKGSATLLLYQDARCGMDILDETVGSERWTKEYYEVKGNVYCRVGIKTESGEWVYKSDCGMESNVDAQKGEASDAFKRAVVNWGIGRELYTTPRIKINCKDEYYNNDRLTMTFSVKEIGYECKTITRLVIADRYGYVVFVYDNGKVVTGQGKTQVATQPTAVQKTNAEILKEYCVQLSKTEDKKEIRDFYDFYTKRLKEREWSGVFDVQKLWAMHIQRHSRQRA